MSFIFPSVLICLVVAGKIRLSPACTSMTLPSLSVSLTTAFCDDGDDETVQSRYVNGHRTAQIVEQRMEIRALHEHDAFVLLGNIFRAVVGQHCVVDALGSLLGMELPVVAVFVLTLEVIDAIGDIARLLDFTEEAPLADAVDASGGEEEAITLLDVIVVDSVHDRVVGHHLLILRE